MKKNLIYLFAVCLMLAFTAQVGLAQGRVLQTINYRIEVPQIGFDDCNQMETFSGSGFVHFVGRVFLDKDGLVRVDFNNNAHFTITGDVTGIQSVINETVRQQGILAYCGFNQDIVGRQRIISRGPLQNDFVDYSYHFNVDPDTCLVTMSEPTLSIDCRGR